MRKIHRKYTLEDMQYIAASHGGKCLSKEYLGMRGHLRWQCKNNHTWNYQPRTIINGRWCPLCSSKHKSQEICRAIIEFLTGKYFPSNRKLLGNRLQLDGYCKELNAAFEYNGEQHYQYRRFFHKTKKEFLDQQKRDRKKTRLCKKLGIELVVVEYKVLTSVSTAAYVIEDKLKMAGVPIVNTADKFSINAESVYVDQVREMSEFAEKRGGKLLSTFYISYNVSLEWQCSKGHTWTAPWNQVRKNNFRCAECRGWKRVAKSWKRVTIEDAIALAKSKNGECISTEYKNDKTVLKWKCGTCDTEWETRYSHIKGGGWCPRRCNYKEATIETMKKMAESKNGKCLSKKYINNSTHLEWECSEGHRWPAVPNSIQQGHWCPHCGGKQGQETKVKKYGNNGLSEKSLELMRKKLYGRKKKKEKN